MLQFKSIEEWLASLKLSRYVDNFEQAGVTTLDAVTRLSHADLSGLGIVLLGHQRKIMNSIQAMRAQLSISMSEGFLVWSSLFLFNLRCEKKTSSTYPCPKAFSCCRQRLVQSSLCCKLLNFFFFKALSFIWCSFTSLIFTKKEKK